MDTHSYTSQVIPWSHRSYTTVRSLIPDWLWECWWAPQRLYLDSCLEIHHIHIAPDKRRKTFNINIHTVVEVCYYCGFSVEDQKRFLSSVLAFITHYVCKVQDDEGAVGHARFLEVRVRLAGQVLVIQLAHPALIWTFGHLTITETIRKLQTNKSSCANIFESHLVGERRTAWLTLHSSSKRSKRPSCPSMRLMHCWLSLNSILLQASSSRMYSSCSKWNTCCRQTQNKNITPKNKMRQTDSINLNRSFKGTDELTMQRIKTAWKDEHSEASLATENTSSHWEDSLCLFPSQNRGQDRAALPIMRTTNLNSLKSGKCDAILKNLHPLNKTLHCMRARVRHTCINMVKRLIPLTEIV